MTKKKIVFVIESLRMGGAEKSLTTLFNNFDFSPYEVDLLLFNKGGELEAFLPSNIRIIRRTLPKNGLGYFLSRIHFHLAKKRTKTKVHTAQLFWKSFGQLFSKEPQTYDLAIAYNQGFATYYVADKILAKKKLAWVNTDYQKAGYHAEWDLEFYRNYHKIITVSEAAKDAMESVFGPDEITQKLEVIEDLIDYKTIEQGAKESTELLNYDGMKILSVGRLHKSKGYQLALGAAKILKEKGLNFKWWIIGEGEERKPLEDLIKQFQLQEYIVLKGKDMNPYKYMNDADVFVQTSVFEGFSLTLREAKFLKKPIVTTNFPSLQSAISHEENGLVVAMDENEIANAILRICKDTTLVAKLKSNLEKSRKDFSSLEKLTLIIKEN